jgi:GWxTD domain-containing protein
MRRASYIAALLIAVFCLGCASRINPDTRSRSRRHYQQSVELYRQGEAESAVWELEQAIRLDPCYAEAHDLLGKIYLRRGDIRGRWMATKRALRAVSLAPHEPQYRYNLAMVYRERGFGYNARREFRKVLEVDSTFWEAQYQLGLLEEESALKYESQDKHRKAADAFDRAIQIAPGEYHVRYHLGLNLGEMERWEEAAEHLGKAVEVEPGRHEAQLLLAVALQQMGLLEDAEKAYREAFEKMSQEEREPYQTLEYLASEDESVGHDSIDREDFLRRFWKERDPTPTTLINERRLEHYRRVAHANVHFAAPKLSLPGWKTKRGEFYIRYGEPTVKWRELGEVRTGAGLVPPRWVWSYGDENRAVTLIFADTFLNGEYNFPFPDKNWRSADFRNSPATVALRMVQSSPENYQHDYGGELLEFAYRTVEFRGPEGMTDLEVVYGIPNMNLSFSRSGQMAQAAVERRAVLFDPDWNEVDRVEGEQSFQVPPTQADNPNRMVVEKAEFQVPPGRYRLALNIRDERSRKVGIVKTDVQVGRYDDQTLAISSLVLANRLYSVEGAERFQRGDLVVVPRLGRHFESSQPLLVYYEVYNLTRDSWGDTWYQTEYTIARRPEKRSLVSRALSAITSPFGTGQKWESVSSTTEYRGTFVTEIGQLEVDVSGAAAGRYSLILTITDMNTGHRAEREVEFVLVE